VANYWFYQGSLLRKSASTGDYFVNPKLMVYLFFPMIMFCSNFP
jgi:hypothetical protein